MFNLNFTKMKFDESKMILLVNDCEGRYIPVRFSLGYGLPENFKNWDEIKEDIQFLDSMEDKDMTDEENEKYDQAWDNILNNAQMIDLNGNELTIYQNGDVWAYPKDMEIPDDYFE